MRPLILAFLLLSTNLHATSLVEIAAFSKETCDKIKTDGKIRREQIEGSINGNISGVAKLLGASLDANGKIAIDETTYDGIPFEDIPDQLSDARSCRKEITKLLLKERQEIELLKAEKLDEQNIAVNQCKASLQCDLKALNRLCMCRTEIMDFAEEKSWSKKQTADAYFESCDSYLKGFLKCWQDNGESLNLQRSKCDVVLAENSISKPEPERGSCVATSSYDRL